MSIFAREKVGFERRAGNTVAFLFSVVFHTALLLLLACWIFTAGKPSQGLLLSAEIGDSEHTALDMLETFELSPTPDVAQEQEEHLDPVDSLDVDFDSVLDTPTDHSGGLQATLTSLSTGSVVDELASSSKGRGASFFGAYAQGNRFVYVLDSSRSMKGDRWTYACTQLLDSLNGLKPGQEFFVICFDINTTFLFNTPPQRAKYFDASEDDIVVRVKRWLRSRTLGRATMPADALRYALNFNPDAIFLLSDGELQDDSMMMLRSINNIASERRQIPIHTVHLFSLQGRMTLQQIAMENQGTFTPIEGHKGFGTFRRR